MVGTYLVCGVEDQSDGSLKVYIYSRPEGWFITINTQKDIDLAKRVWSQSGSNVGGELYIRNVPSEFIQKE